jgi:hypothetical protein
MEQRLGRGLPEGFLASQIATIHTRLIAEVQPVAGVLDFLKGHAGVARCIASSSSVDYIGKCLERMAMTRWFEHRFSGQDVERGKPHPDSLGRGGTIPPQRALAREMNRRGHEVHVLTHDSLAGAMAADGGRLHALASAPQWDPAQSRTSEEEGAFVVGGVLTSSAFAEDFLAVHNAVRPDICLIDTLLFATVDLATRRGLTLRRPTSQPVRLEPGSRPRRVLSGRPSPYAVSKMRVFLTGATGLIGAHPVGELIDAGHQGVGLSRSAAGRRFCQALNRTSPKASATSRSPLQITTTGFAPNVSNTCV